MEPCRQMLQGYRSRDRCPGDVDKMLYQIAGLTVEMKVKGRTAKQAMAYAAPKGAGPVDFSVGCDPAKVLERYPQLGDLDVAEYLGTGASFAIKLLDFDGFQLHASAVLLEKRAYLFSAPSGIGKSTHAERWVRLFGAKYLNDDKPALRRMEQGWYAYGTPWSGKWDLSRPEGAPVGGVSFICRRKESGIVPITPDQALPLLMSQAEMVLNRKRTERMLELADQLLREVPMYQLYCRNSDDEARLAWAVMTSAR